MADDRTGRNAALIAVFGGAVVALAVVLIVLLLRADDGGTSTTIAADTTAAPTTGAPATTGANTTDPASSTTGSPATTSTSTTTTTVPPFAGDTLLKQGGIVGDPGGQLTDVRFAQREGFTRIVFDFTGAGIPAYQIGYAPGPFTDTAGTSIAVGGNRFLLVTVFPAMRWDITDPDNLVRVYTGPERIDLSTRSLTEMVFLDDFEATMQWVIGVSAEQDFTVGTLGGPPRIYVDVAD